MLDVISMHKYLSLEKKNEKIKQIGLIESSNELGNDFINSFNIGIIFIYYGGSSVLQHRPKQLDNNAYSKQAGSRRERINIKKMLNFSVFKKNFVSDPFGQMQ